jgi:hypothetical protein
VSDIDKVVGLLSSMQRDIRDLQTESRLGNSSLEGGINNYDPNTGQLVGRIGNQFDGSYGYGQYSGPKPPTPTKPILTPCPGGLTVTWDGKFTPDPQTGAPRYAQMNFTRVEVHVGNISGFYDASAISLRGTIETPRGGDCQVIPLAIETKYVVLVCRNAAGGFSDPSEEASGTPGSWVTDAEVEVIRTDLATANSAIAAANVELTATFDLATHAQTTADGKGRAWFTTEPPVATSTYDVWFDADNDNKPYKWDGSSWIAQPLGNAAIGNLDAGKISTGYLAAARILTESLSGDKITANTLDADRIVANSITGDKIKANEIIGVHIRSRQIEADHIVAGTITADELHAEAVTAAKLDAYAVTSKVVTGGTFRTGYPGDDRIEIIDEVAWDPYLGYNRSIRDTIRWVRGYDGALIGEVRGYMGDINAYGLHLNSTLELGNLQSTIYQVGRRDTSSSHSRVRAGSFSHTVSGGTIRHNYGTAMDNNPACVVVSLTNNFDHWISDHDTSGFELSIRYPAGHASAGAAPGDGAAVSGMFYVEDVS